MIHKDSFRKTREWLERNINFEKPNENKHDVLSNAFIELLQSSFESFPEVIFLMWNFLIKKFC